MAWNTIRKATPEDYALLEQRARAFASRHGLDANMVEPVTVYELEGLIEDARWEWGQPRLRQYWRNVVRRALAHPRAEGIAYGYVGYWTD